MFFKFKIYFSFSYNKRDIAFMQIVVMLKLSTVSKGPQIFIFFFLNLFKESETVYRFIIIPPKTAQ